MLNYLVENNIDLERKGAQWLLLILEELEIQGSVVKVREFLRTLNVFSDREYKACIMSIEDVLKHAGYRGSLKDFQLGALQYMKECK